MENKIIKKAKDKYCSCGKHPSAYGCFYHHFGLKDFLLSELKDLFERGYADGYNDASMDLSERFNLK